jgi:uncharacterized membrane protein YiaA
MLLIAGVDVASLAQSGLLVGRQSYKGEKSGEETMSFGIYIVGYLILIIGLAIGANMLHLPPKWIAVGILCLVGVAIMHGVTSTRQRDPSS